MIRCVSSRLRRLPKVSSLVSRCTVVMSTSMRSDRRPRPGLLYSRCMRTWGVLAGAVAVVGTVLGTAAGLFVPGAGYLVQGAASFGLNAYSRSQESEADQLAVKILRDAGKPEWSLRYALETLQQRSGGSSGGWLSTHPALQERIATQPAVDVAEARRVCTG